MIIPNNFDEQDQKTLIQFLFSEPSLFVRAKPILNLNILIKNFKKQFNIC